MKAFFEKHPILALLAFNLIAIPVFTLLGFAISYFGHWHLGMVLFLESLLILVVCYSAVNGNSHNNVGFGRHNAASDTTHYFGAYHFAIKYGILGIGLFVLSGVFGMK